MIHNVTFNRKTSKCPSVVLLSTFVSPRHFFFFFFLHAAIKEPLKSILQLTTNASHRKLNMALSPLLNGVILRAKEGKKKKKISALDYVL